MSQRYRITVRGDDPRVELRGYVQGYGAMVALAEAMAGIGVVVASPAEPDYDPFAPAEEQS